MQWLDEPTAEVLAFAVRRLDGTGIRMLAAERVTDGGQPEGLRCCPPGTVELAVSPLSDAEVADLVRADLGTDLPPAALRTVQETAAGNPLYAQELGRAALNGGDVPPRLRDLLLPRARALPEPARRTLLVASAAARPSLTVLRATGLPDPVADLAAAERLGVATADADGDRTLPASADPGRPLRRRPAATPADRRTPCWRARSPIPWSGPGTSPTPTRTRTRPPPAP